jgi:signal transduction histidine kinase
MYEVYDELPFGVALLSFPSLTIEYSNEIFKKILQITESNKGRELLSIKGLKNLKTYIYNAALKESCIRKVEINKEEYFDIIIKRKADKVLLFFHLLENSEEIKKDLKLKEEREQFLSISTELKTKCEIIEILRNREKEHLMHLKDVINNISEGLIVFDSKGNFSFCNKAVYSILDVTSSDFLRYHDIYKKYKIECMDFPGMELKELYLTNLENNQPIKGLVLYIEHNVTRETKYVEFNSNPIINQRKELLYTIITIKDVTEVKGHELHAEEQANFIKDVIDTMDVPMAVVDYPEMSIKLANKNFDYMAESFSGEKLDSHGLINKNASELFKNKAESGLYKALQLCGALNRQYTFSPYELTDENNNKRFYKLKFKPFKGKLGNTNRVYIHALDITEEISHSLELEKITNLKDEFFTIISHELRTPLTIIYSSLQLAYDIYGKEIGPNIDKTLGRIHQNCSRLLKLINNILDISKAEAGFLTLSTANFDIVQVTEAVVNSVNFYAKSKGIDLIFDTNIEEAEVSMDKDKYEKILLNLLSNAVKFTPEGKQILITLEIDEEHITLSVKDEGVGIPEDKLESIFDRFAQVNSSLSRRAEGTGIGLSLVKRLVELMDGTIAVESEIETGSEFIIKFNNVCLEGIEEENYSMFDANMNDKINIEFSDVN